MSLTRRPAYLRLVAFTIYILRCNDGTYYTGQSTGLEKRLEAHNKGTGAKYTRGRGPVTLVYQESAATLREAFIRERQIKRLSRARKEALILGKTTRRRSANAVKNNALRRKK